RGQVPQRLAGDVPFAVLLVSARSASARAAVRRHEPLRGRGGVTGPPIPVQLAQTGAAQAGIGVAFAVRETEKAPPLTRIMSHEDRADVGVCLRGIVIAPVVVEVETVTLIREPEVVDLTGGYVIMTGATGVVLREVRL